MPDARSTTLYVVRHGETEYNRKHIMQGSGVDCPLNERGTAQANALATRLANEVSFDAVYASTLTRARQTARIVATPHEPVSFAYLDDLKEIDWGIYEGTEPSEHRDKAMETIKEAWRKGHVERAVEEGESPRQVEARARRALDIIVSSHPGENVLVVTHGRYMRIMLASALYNHDLTRMPDVPHANTGLYVIHYNGGTYRATVRNSVAHLSA